MPGTHYIALSGLRARADDLDRLAADIANASTIGYKGERASRAAAERASFGDQLKTAIDATSGERRLDVRPGLINATGRSLDVAIDGDGFFSIQTDEGVRYTRDGRFTKSASGQLVTADGDEVLGTGGPIALGDGEIRVDGDGTVWNGATKAGQLAVVEFDEPARLARDRSSLLRADGMDAKASTTRTIRAGALEQSNVTMSDRLAELVQVSRGMEALQKALSLVMNDVDGKAIEQFGRR
ncbi:MAG TPA: flagellar hook basal-body protein [Vicinamibacterales bacterium]|nr:flagellar hook basal-body protein [Vicinamibacterales bacterium]